MYKQGFSNELYVEKQARRIKERIERNYLTISMRQEFCRVLSRTQK